MVFVQGQDPARWEESNVGQPRAAS